VDGVSSGRTLGVLAACLAFMLAAAATGLVLVHTVQGPPGSTWNDYRVTARGLAVAFSAEGCSRIAGADVDERDGQVRVTLVMERDLPWYGYCASRSTAQQVRVALDRPLGNRRVLDGACLGEERRARACVRDEVAATQRSGTAVSTSAR
jgi:hypothetical protein